MKKKDATSIRGALEYLDSRGEVLHVKKEVDPIYEIAGIQKALEKGPILLFEKIKGYPNFIDLGNFFGRREPLADLFDVDDPKKLKFKFVEAIKNPIPPKIVKEAPCQEVVITKNIDVLGTLPVIKHTEKDAGRIMGCGNQLLCDVYRKGDTNVSFNRIHFRGKDWASLSTAQITHIGRAGAVPFLDDLFLANESHSVRLIDCLQFRVLQNGHVTGQGGYLYFPADS